MFIMYRIIICSAISYVHHKYYHHNCLTVNLLLQGRYTFMSHFKSKYQAKEPIYIWKQSKQANFFFFFMWPCDLSARPLLSIGLHVCLGNEGGSLSARNQWEQLAPSPPLGSLPSSSCRHTCSSPTRAKRCPIPTPVTLRKKHVAGRRPRQEEG